MSTPKKIVLISSDGETFEVEETVALESQTIKHMIEDDCADNTIPLPNVTSKILARIIEYCRKHVEASGAGKDAADEEALKKWDAKFVEVDQGVLFDLILAANYLNIKTLLDLTCQTLADMNKKKTPEAILLDLTYRMVAAMIKGKTPKEILLDLTYQMAADMIKGKTPEEICKIFYIKNFRKLLAKVIESCRKYLQPPAPRPRRQGPRPPAPRSCPQGPQPPAPRPRWQVPRPPVPRPCPQGPQPPAPRPGWQVPRPPAPRPPLLARAGKAPGLQPPAPPLLARASKAPGLQPPAPPLLARAGKALGLQPPAPLRPPPSRPPTSSPAAPSLQPPSPAGPARPSAGKAPRS